MSLGHRKTNTPPAHKPEPPTFTYKDAAYALAVLATMEDEQLDAISAGDCDYAKIRDLALRARIVFQVHQRPDGRRATAPDVVLKFSKKLPE